MLLELYVGEKCYLLMALKGTGILTVTAISATSNASNISM